MSNNNETVEFIWDGLPVQELETRLELEQALPDDSLFIYTPLKEREFIKRIELLPVGA